MKERNRELAVKTFASFLATVMGIAVTFGVSKLADKSNEKNLKRQSVYSVLTDLNNTIHYFQKDSTRCAEYYEWLPGYLDRYSNNLTYPVDSAFAQCYYLDHPTLLTQRAKPIGRNIIRNFTPSDVHDMQLHRFIELAYDAMDRVQNIQAQLDKYYDEFNKVSLLIMTSKEYYDEQKAVERYFDNETIREFSVMLSWFEETGAFGVYCNMLRDYRNRILGYAGLTMEDFERFDSERNSRRKASESAK